MLGRYRLTRELGGGAFGSVWLAEDTWLSKNVALKIPREAVSDFAKFIAEPKLLAALDHPNIIRLITAEKADDTVFMVMDFVEGTSLKEKLASGPLPVAEAVEIAKAILSALVHAHEKGIVHRDLKPANILLTSKGRAKVADFGTAHALESGNETVAAGTLFYMAKEQLLGRVMAASDIYSVGVILYEMLTGKLPYFEREGAKLVQKILAGEPPARVEEINKEIPKSLGAIVQRAVERDLGKRFRRAEQMLEALEAYEAGKDIPEAPAPPAPHPVYERFSHKAPKLAETFGKTREYMLSKVHSERGRKDGQMMLPSGIAMSGAGRIYVTDAIRSCVHVFERNGAFVQRLGREGSRMEGRESLRFHNPTAIAIDRESRVYVCDTKNSQIQVFSEEGSPLAYFGRPLVVVGAHEEESVIGLNYPRGLALNDSEDLLYVSDTGNSRLRMFRMDGTPLKTLGGRGERTGEFDIPQGMAVGREGKVFVADTGNYRIQVFDRDLSFHSSFGSRGGEPGQFSHPPVSVTTAVTGELAVCDETSRIHLFEESGAFIGYVEGKVDGSDIARRFSGCAFHGTDTLVCVDGGGCSLFHFEYKEHKT